MVMNRSAVWVFARLLAFAGLLALNYSTPARAAFDCWDCNNCPGNPDDACCDPGTRYTSCTPAGGGCSVGANCPPF